MKKPGAPASLTITHPPAILILPPAALRGPFVDCPHSRFQKTLRGLSEPPGGQNLFENTHRVTGSNTSKSFYLWDSSQSAIWFHFFRLFYYKI